MVYSRTINYGETTKDASLPKVVASDSLNINFSLNDEWSNKDSVKFIDQI